MSTEDVTEKTQQGINENGEFVRKRTASVESSADTKSTVVNVIWYIYGVIAFLLGIRFILKLFGANSANGFVDFVYSVSGVFSAPFDTIFGVQTAGTGSTRTVFEPSILVALAVYALVAWGVAKALTLNQES